MKLICFTFFLILSLYSFSAIAQSDRIEDLIEKYSTANPVEKIYLHTDKPYYFKEDTIWFKAYIVSGAKNQLATMSGAVYVDLLGDKGKIADVKLPVINGMAKGCIPISFSVKQGTYKIRAYTQWLRNTGEQAFFERSILIGNVQQKLYSYVVASVPQANNNQNETLIQYLTADGKPLRNRAIDYKLLSGTKTLLENSGNTDASGILKLTFKSPTKNASKFINILSSVPLADTSLTTEVSLNTADPALNIQFLPEGGNLVNGIRSRMGVKSVGWDGLGKDINGEIQDSDGKTVTEFKTEHLGMGKFSFSPEAGKTYKAVINNPGETPIHIPLPPALNSGPVLAVYATNPDTLLIRAHALPALYSTSPKYKLVGMAGNELVFSANLSISKPVNSIRIPSALLSAGIIQFTLFSETNTPLCERLFFNQHAAAFKLNVSAAKQMYRSREKTELQINASGQDKPIVGSFSVAIVDENIVPADQDFEPSIFSELLLKSDLKGNIEKPGFYFDDTKDRSSELDLLMLTQGYRKFVWNEVLMENNKLPQFKPEPLGTTFSGIVHTIFTGKPVSNARVTMFSINARVLEQTTTDAAGRFSFPGFLLTDGVKLSFKAAGVKDKSVEIKLDSLPGLYKYDQENWTYKPLNRFALETYRKAQYARFEQQQKYNIGFGLDLQEVEIKAKKNDAFRSDNLNGRGRADQVILGSELQTCPTLIMCIQNLIAGVVFSQVQTEFGPAMAPFLTRNSPNGRPMLLSWNGIMIDLENYADYLELSLESPQDIEAIEVLRSTVYTNTYGAQDRGVLVITTRSGYSPKGKHVHGYVNISPKGFDKVREFYTPRYDIPAAKKQPDYRSTIYWNPSVVTNDSGKATLSFFNSDAKGTFRVTIEGITADGKLGRQVYRYKVE